MIMILKKCATRKSLLIIPILLGLLGTSALCAPCEGAGTAFFFGNGMFNTSKEARESLDALKRHIRKRNFINQKKKNRFELSYKRSEPFFEQLLNVAAQRGLDDYQNFWLWLSSLREPPDWFRKAAIEGMHKSLRAGLGSFPDLSDHLERYASRLHDGFQIILISHSQGNLYANQVFKRLPEFSMEGTWLEKQRALPIWPKLEDVFANVQVASPAKQTFHNSPWTTFADDFVIKAVREMTGTLPANVGAKGASTAVEGDLLGHNFVKAYLRVPESREKILSDIESAYVRLKFPIAYFQRALTVARRVNIGKNAPSRPEFFAYFKSPNTSSVEIDGNEERFFGKTERDDEVFVYCRNLPLGITAIQADTHIPGNRQKTLNFEFYSGNHALDRKLEKRVTFKAKNKSDGDILRWSLGSIKADPGKGREPLEIRLKLLDHPIPEEN